MYKYAHESVKVDDFKNTKFLRYQFRRNCQNVQETERDSEQLVCLN
jgi:hypothetical protein